jgi:hypothetical protein
MDCLYFKTNKFQYWKLVLVGLNAFITFWKEQNESINRLRRVEAYPVSAEELVP